MLTIPGNQRAVSCGDGVFQGNGNNGQYRHRRGGRKVYDSEGEPVEEFGSVGR